MELFFAIIGIFLIFAGCALIINFISECGIITAIGFLILVVGLAVSFDSARFSYCSVVKISENKYQISFEKNAPWRQKFNVIYTKVAPVRYEDGTKLGFSRKSLEDSIKEYEEAQEFLKTNGFN